MKTQLIIKNSLALVCGILGLSGCAVFAVGAVGAAAGTTAAVATDPRSSGSVVDDNTVAVKLNHKYANYSNANINAYSYNGNVLLTGQVPNEKMRKHAEFQAEVTPGVKRIYDYLEVRLPQSFASSSKDTLITTQLKTKLIGLKGVNSNSVKVITSDGVVYLFGIVTTQEAQKIADSAADIDGVRKVVTLFEYVTAN